MRFSVLKLFLFNLVCICTVRVAEYELKRPWESCLVINKQMWKDRAAQGWISPLQESTFTGKFDL